MDEQDPIDDLVDWQMSNQQFHRLPDRDIPHIPACANCGSMEWHGFRRSTCGGSHLNTEEAEAQKGPSNHSDTPAQIPYWPPFGL